LIIFQFLLKKEKVGRNMREVGEYKKREEKEKRDGRKRNRSRQEKAKREIRAGKRR
jgi:hypothetical protein